ncbi:AAA family ATPase [Neorhizobium sp. JUb45]|uniref:ATP-dependent nuclease n=1 Tax=Neorhizobium sp. JUb45 TaxID=2485113 RepID=UPI0010F0D97C|nr:AAA family ATPase [Neorhizobium sp. JUb45]TCQ96207.1 putative ATP-dependent endonuclease of OLD family [Neorhizobium sp. JUb45]
MQIKRVKISNFRSIRQADIEFGDITVLIGTNNAGKSAILEAIRIALTRRWGQRGTGFTEYDVHLCEARPDPKIGDPVVIEVELQEEVANEWPDNLHGELEDIIQLDPMSGRASIIMRVSCLWDVAEESFVPRWEFLNVDRNPLAGRGARAVNLQEFFQFLPVFYLEALRDVSDEFSSRSQFWGKLLRTVQIPENLERKSKRIFDLLNRRLLDADPLLANLATGLSHISRVAATDVPGQADLRLLPLNTWDILSKAEVIYQTEGGKPWLPLAKHGQGVQSLSVMFLFKAFVELILGDLYRPESSAVLALEEPETHLHPQAARSLWRHISELPGQKIVTTHSPYFLQHIPFRDIRVVRVEDNGTSVSSLPRQFRAAIPHIPALDAVVAASGGLVTYDRGLNEVVLFGTLPQNLYQQLIIAYNGRPDTVTLHAALRALSDASKEFISDAELDQLETFARRIRGEIFFARRWLLVEGQSDYHLVHGIAKGLDYDLDEHGVAVIDFQNCGNPEIFAVLARALRYPWLIVVDGDPAGQGYLAKIAGRSFSQQEMARRAHSLPAGYLEQQLVADGLQAELKTILASLGNANAANLNDADLISTLKKDKSGYAAVLARQCAENPALAQRMPSPFRIAIQSLRGLR